MSRPVQDLKANSAAPDPAQARAAPAVGLEPGLDVNGVDTSLSAAAKAISRAVSGIRDEEEQHVSYVLKRGQTVEETGPDGAVRRVRVLPTSF